MSVNLRGEEKKAVIKLQEPAVGNYNSRIRGGLPHSPARCYALAFLRPENNKAEGISVNWLLDCISRTQRRGHLLRVVQILGCCRCACLLGDPEPEE